MIKRPVNLFLTICGLVMLAISVALHETPLYMWASDIGILCIGAGGLLISRLPMPQREREDNFQSIPACLTAAYVILASYNSSWFNQTLRVHTITVVLCVVYICLCYRWYKMLPKHNQTQLIGT